MPDIIQILEDLHDAKIDYEVCCVYKGGGYDVNLGSSRDGFLCGSTCEKFSQAAVFLMESAFIYYPDSEFTKKYKL